MLPDHEGSLSAVFGAFAKACGRLMPKLQMAELSIMVPAIVPLEASVAGPGDGAGGPSFVHGGRPWGVWYFSPGVQRSLDEYRQAWQRPIEGQHNNKRRLLWDTQG